MIRRAAMMSLFLPALLVAASVSADEFEIETRVWIDGELRGSPMVVVEDGKEGTVEVAQGDSGWRMSLMVEPPMAHEQASRDAIWIRVGLSERIEGEWVFLTDTMVGARFGQPARISVVDNAEDGTPVPEEQARVLVELSARPVSPDGPESD